MIQSVYPKCSRAATIASSWVCQRLRHKIIRQGGREEMGPGEGQPQPQDSFLRGLTQSMAQGVAQVAPTILMGLMNKYGGGNADSAAGAGAAGGAPLLDG